MPQRKALGAPGRDEAARIPMGNAMPISSPQGARIATAVAIRIGVVAPSIRSMTSGVSSPNTATVATSAPRGTSVSFGRRGSVTRSLTMLPIPLDTSSEKSTTVSAYVGWPRKMLSRWSWAISIRRKPSPMPAK